MLNVYFTFIFAFGFKPFLFYVYFCIRVFVSLLDLAERYRYYNFRRLPAQIDISKELRLLLTDIEAPSLMIQWIISAIDFDDQSENHYKARCMSAQNIQTPKNLLTAKTNTDILRCLLSNQIQSDFTSEDSNSKYVCTH